MVPWPSECSAFELNANFVGEYLLFQKEPIELQNIRTRCRVNGGVAFSGKPSLSLGMRLAFRLL